MALINVPDIQNLESATPELWNSRFGIITNVINGNLDSSNLASGAVTSSKLATGSVTGAKILNYMVNRKDDDVASVLGTASIQSGQSIKASASVGTLTIPIVFPVAFTAVPIVVAGCAGDSATTGAYGIGGINLANGIVPRANAITNVGFNLTISKADSTNFPSSGYIWVTWIALGQ